MSCAVRVYMYIAYRADASVSLPCREKARFRQTAETLSYGQKGEKLSDQAQQAGEQAQENADQAQQAGEQAQENAEQAQQAGEQAQENAEQAQQAGEQATQQ